MNGWGKRNMPRGNLNSSGSLIFGPRETLVPRAQKRRSSSQFDTVLAGIFEDLGGRVTSTILERYPGYYSNQKAYFKEQANEDKVDILGRYIIPFISDDFIRRVLKSIYRSADKKEGDIKDFLHDPYSILTFYRVALGKRKDGESGLLTQFRSIWSHHQKIVAKEEIRRSI